MYDSNENRYSDMQNRNNARPGRRASAMAVGSVGCAVVSIFCILTGFFAVVFGALAVLLSFLSKGKKDKLERPAVIGRAIGTVVAIIGAIMVIYSVAFVFNRYGSFENYYNAYIEAIEESYGTSL